MEEVVSSAQRSHSVCYFYGTNYGYCDSLGLQDSIQISEMRNQVNSGSCGKMKLSYKLPIYRKQVQYIAQYPTVTSIRQNI